MKAKEWKKVKKMLPFCSACPFMEIACDKARNFAVHRFCNADKGKNLIDIQKCPQNKF